MKKNNHRYILLFLILFSGVCFSEKASANPYGSGGGSSSWGSNGSNGTKNTGTGTGGEAGAARTGAPPSSTSRNTSTGETSAFSSENSDEIFKEAIDVGKELIKPGQDILQGLSVLAIMGVGGMAAFGSFPKGWAIGIIGGLSVMLLSEEFANWIVDIAKTNKPETFDDISNTVVKTTEILSADVSNLMYITSGIGVIGLSTMGFFGAMPWKWVGSLIAGLMVIAGSSDIVGYIVSGLANG
jgi:type IV secretory pathway VirB2 component (pilin)